MKLANHGGRAAIVLDDAIADVHDASGGLGGRAVAVIGALADRVDEADAWSHLAGLTVGQDISDRALQFAAGSQFSLGVGATRQPPRFLQPGQVLGTWIDGIGTIRNRCV